MRDPFSVLGVADDADDAEIRRRYLSLLREFPPDREPERFQEFRAAYESLSDERKRLETRLLHTNAAALTGLSMKSLRAGPRGGDSSGGGAPDAPTTRATRQTVAALLAEGIARSLSDFVRTVTGKAGGE